MTTPLCRHRDCPAPATHVVVAHVYTWHRESLAASDAARLCTTWDTEPGAPPAYYCEVHAQERPTP